MAVDAARTVDCVSDRPRFARRVRSTLAVTAVRPPAELALASSIEPVAIQSGHMGCSWGAGAAAAALDVTSRTLRRTGFLHKQTTKCRRMRKIASVSSNNRSIRPRS